MSTERLQKLRSLLRTSATRLVHLNDIDAPDAIIANEIGLLLRLAFATIPEPMGAAFSKFMGGAARVYHGVCNCGNDVTADVRMCPKCNAAECEQS